MPTNSGRRLLLNLAPMVMRRLSGVTVLYGISSRVFLEIVVVLAHVPSPPREPMSRPAGFGRPALYLGCWLIAHLG